MRKLIVGLGILSTAILLICASGVIYASRLKPIEPPVTVQPLNATIVFNLVNKERVKAGLKPLVRDARLDASTQAKADDMVKYNYFDHVRDGKHGYQYVFDYAPNQCSYASENISIMNDPSGDNNADTVIGWMNSKPHHDAMLNPDYTLTGIAINDNKVVQHFCITK